MSLINDALKRAHQSQEKIPGSLPPLVPVARPSSRGRGWILPVAIVLLLAAGGIFIWFAFAHKPSRQAATTIAPVASVAPIVVVPPPQALPAPAPAPVAVEAQSNAVDAEPVADTNVVEVLPSEAWPKVQGIIYTQPNPMAIVNGKMVNVGDRLGHYLVKQIAQHDVTFQRDDGSLKQLGIGQ